MELISANGLVREHVPTQLLNSRTVWSALLKKMPMMAMVRNLGKMASIGMFTGPENRQDFRSLSYLGKGVRHGSPCAGGTPIFGGKFDFGLFFSKISAFLMQVGTLFRPFAQVDMMQVGGVRPPCAGMI